MEAERIKDRKINRTFPILTKKVKCIKDNRSSGINSTIWQFSLVSDLKELYRYVKYGRKKEFKNKFRAIAPAMDEHISCETTYRYARIMMINKASKQEIIKFLHTSHRLRLPTMITAHYVKLINGQPHRMTHPTSLNTLMYGGELNGRGRLKYVNHTSFDKIRSNEVLKQKTITDMVNTAVTITLGLGVQPPFASNSLCKLDLNDPIARDAHNKRELLKFNNSDFNPAITQPFDSPWYPELKRSTSPLRLLPIKL